LYFEWLIITYRGYRHTRKSRQTVTPCCCLFWGTMCCIPRSWFETI